MPGPIYNTMKDWNKNFPFNKGKFLKGQRGISEALFKQKEKTTPSPVAYHNFEAWTKTEASPHGNFKM